MAHAEAHRPRKPEFRSVTKEHSMTEHAPTYDELLARIAHLEGQRRASEQVVAELDRVAVELRRSERRFRSLAEQVPNIAVQGYDRERRVVYWNAASEALYGYGREEATGRRLEDLIIPDPMKVMVVAGIEAWITGGEPIPAGELVLRTKDGSPVNVFSSHVMVQDARGEPEMFCLDVDLTGRRALEEQLRASQRMEVVGRLAGGIAHDFNNLLTVILSCAEVLQEDMRAGHPAADDVAQIQAAARRASDLTRQLLAFARKQIACRVPLDLNVVLGRSENLLRRALGEAIELAIGPGPGLWNVRLDPGQLEQVISEPRRERPGCHAGRWDAPPHHLERARRRRPRRGAPMDTPGPACTAHGP